MKPVKIKPMFMWGAFCCGRLQFEPQWTKEAAEKIAKFSKKTSIQPVLVTAPPKRGKRK